MSSAQDSHSREWWGCPSRADAAGKTDICTTSAPLPRAVWAGKLLSLLLPGQHTKQTVHHQPVSLLLPGQDTKQTVHRQPVSLLLLGQDTKQTVHHQPVSLPPPPPPRARHKGNNSLLTKEEAGELLSLILLGKNTKQRVHCQPKRKLLSLLLPGQNTKETVHRQPKRRLVSATAERCKCGGMDPDPECLTCSQQRTSMLVSGRNTNHWLTSPVLIHCPLSCVILHVKRIMKKWSWMNQEAGIRTAESLALDSRWSVWFVKYPNQHWLYIWESCLTLCSVEEQRGPSYLHPPIAGECPGCQTFSVWATGINAPASPCKIQPQ